MNVRHRLCVCVKMAKPEPLICDENLAQNWTEFHRSFVAWRITYKDDQLTGRQFSGTVQEVEQAEERLNQVLYRAAVGQFVSCLGGQGRELFFTLFPLPDDKDLEDHLKELDFKDVVRKFARHCERQRNEVAESYKFQSMKQRAGETFNEFLTRLRAQVARCNYKCNCGESTEDRAIRDQIVMGVQQEDLQRKLLAKKGVTTDDVIRIARTFVEAKEDSKLLRKEEVAVVAAINSQKEEQVAAVARKCFRCQQSWVPGHRCSRNCYLCGDPGHLKRQCPAARQRKTVNAVEKGASKICTLNICRVGRRMRDCSWYKELIIDEELVNFKIDTGAEVNAIPRRLVGNRNIRLSNIHVVNYNQEPIQVFGTARVQCTVASTGEERDIEFLVVDNRFEPILGLETCVRLRIIKRIDAMRKSEGEAFVNNNADVFEGLGRFPGEMKILLRDDVKPKVHYQKRFPLSIRDRLKEELESMEERGIIERVDHATEWVNNVQVVEKKDGRLRVCLDPRPLNQGIMREHFPIPTIEDLTANLAGKKVFSVMDLEAGFWHIVLEEKSAELTTFMTPFGRYKFKRLAFGLNCAPEYFQKRMVQIFGGIPGVVIYFDDILITAESDEEHDLIMKKVLERARRNGVKFNPRKVQYKVMEAAFMGNKISAAGIEPLKKYTDAILEMQTPNNKDSVTRFLGLIKYIARFIPSRTQLTAKLRDLVKDGVKFQWEKEHQKEFENMKTIIKSNQVLALFDYKKEITIQTDASKDGLGCVVMQEGRPVAFASRTLTSSEVKYAQIEKELLAIVFACERFHYYVYGSAFTVESDHRPLESLMKKDLVDVSVRLQRLMMRLLKYDQMEVTFKPGKEMLIADCLSRAQVSDTEEDNDLTKAIHAIIKEACIVENNFQYYKQVMEEDEKLKKVCNFVEEEWPSFHKLDLFSQQFYKIRHELHYEKGVLLYGDKMVIPQGLQSKIRKQVHSNHLGIEKTVNRAKELYFWIGMAKEIKEEVQTCRVCEKFQRMNQKETLIQDELPMYPFHRVGMDMAYWRGENYLVLYDAYSNFLVVRKLASKGVAEVIRVLKEVFATVGYPTTIRSDNSPFNSYEFKEFATEASMKLIFSSPLYPQSNGLAEKGVAIAKGIIKRAADAGSIMELSSHLLEYNCTPVASLGLAPVQLFFGRRVKTKLPVAEKALVRRWVREEDIVNRIVAKRRKQEMYYNSKAKDLDALVKGQRVRFRIRVGQWEDGRIQERVGPRSYVIESDGKLYRRNRRHINKCHNNEIIRNVGDETDSEDEDGIDQVSENMEEDSDIFLSFQNGETSAGEESSAETPEVKPVTTRSGRQVRRPLDRAFYYY